MRSIRRPKLKLWEILYDGWEAYETGDFREARRAFKEVLSKDPEYIDTLNGLGAIVFKKNRLQLSEKYYRKAYELTIKKWGGKFPERAEWSILSNRPYLRAMHGLGLVLWRKGKPEEALVIFEKILQLNPNDNRG